MSDFLGPAFAELESVVLRQTRLPGLDDAYATVQRRRRSRLALVAAGIVLLLVVPVAVFALLRGPGGGPPDIGPSPDVSLMPSPSPTGSPTPQAAPMRPRSSGELSEAALPLPSFGSSRCPSGTVQLHNGAFAGTPDGTGFAVTVGVVVVASGDADRRAPAPDLIAEVTCTFGRVQGSVATQVVAYSRSGSGFQLIGVVTTLQNASLGVATLPDGGTIRLRLLEDLEPVGAATYRQRDYRWSGSAFEEVGDPVDLPPAGPTRLGVTAVAAVTGRTAVVTVTVHNGGDVASDLLAVTLRSSSQLTIRLGDLALTSSCPPTQPCQWHVMVAPAGPGESIVGVFQVELPTDGPIGLTVTTNGVEGGTQSNVDGGNTTTVTL